MPAIADHSQQFPSQAKLNTASEFSAVFNNPDCRVSRKGWLLLARKNQLPLNRLGVIVAKKQFPRAVDRNWVKRQVRETFRQNESFAISNEKFDIVVLVRSPNVKQNARFQLEQGFGEIAERIQSHAEKQS